MKTILSDENWEAVRPLLPRRMSGRSTKNGGRPSADDRTVLTGILYVLRHRIAWMMLPTELGYASGVTCWRRLREWQAAGVWLQVQDVLQKRLADAEAFDWDRALPAGSNAQPPAPLQCGGQHRTIQPARWCETL